MTTYTIGTKSMALIREIENAAQMPHEENITIDYVETLCHTALEIVENSPGPVTPTHDGVGDYLNLVRAQQQIVALFYEMDHYETWDYGPGTFEL